MPTTGEQLVPLFGPEEWKGTRCPGALVADPFVQRVLDDFWPLEHWHQLPLPGAVSEQPAWLMEALKMAKSGYNALEREETEKLRKAGEP